MERLDREYQLRILRAAANVYPDEIFVHGDLSCCCGEEIETNCAYLEEHDLVKLVWIGSPNAGRIVHSVTATAVGMDYLANDGDAPAIISALTVRLDIETVKQIFIERVKDARGDRAVKDNVIARISNLPEEGLRNMTQTALTAGLKALPDSLSLFESWAHDF